LNLLAHSLAIIFHLKASYQSYFLTAHLLNLYIVGSIAALHFIIHLGFDSDLFLKETALKTSLEVDIFLHFL